MLRPITVDNLLRLPLCHWRLPLLLLVAVVMASCTGPSTKIEGIPSNLPDIPLYGSASTPPHSMSKGDYPFDSSGNYMTAWVAQGGGSSSGSSSSHSEEMPAPSISKARSGPLPKVVKAPPEIKSSYSPKSTRKTEDEPASKTKKKPASSSSSTAKKKPSSGGGSSKHVVKSTDTLAGIAKKYGTTEAKLKKANGLKSDLIRDGAALIIPK
jgi:LysM repeat protein